MVETIDYDLLIVGSGLAGLRAAIEAAKKSSSVKIAVISKVQVMRSHSVSAEGSGSGPKAGFPEMMLSSVYPGMPV